MSLASWDSSIDGDMLIKAGVRSELLEWFDEVWYDRFTKEVAPGVKVSSSQSKQNFKELTEIDSAPIYFS